MTKLDICHELIQKQIDKIESRWNQEDPRRKEYIIHIKEHMEGNIIVQPKFSHIFFEMDTFIQIVLGCGLQSYVTVEPNLDGIPTPTLHIM